MAKNRGDVTTLCTTTLPSSLTASSKACPPDCNICHVRPHCDVGRGVVKRNLHVFLVFVVPQCASVIEEKKASSLKPQTRQVSFNAGTMPPRTQSRSRPRHGCWQNKNQKTCFIWYGHKLTNKTGKSKYSPTKIFIGLEYFITIQ